MSALVLAVLVATVSAGCYAVGAVVQERLAVQVPMRKLRALLLRRRWWLAVGLGVAGSMLHVVALRYGPLSLVQPLGALTLVLALPVGAALAGRRVTATHWRGAALTTAGLVILLLLTAPVGHVRSLSADQAEAVVAAAVAAVALLAGAARALGHRPAPRSLLYAAAAGLAFGVGSALAQTVTLQVARSGLPGLFTLATPAVAGFAAGGFLLAQAAYRGSGLGAPLATLTVVNPAAAALIGISLLGERYAGGALGAALAAAAAVFAVWGVMLLVKPGEAGARRDGVRVGVGSARPGGLEAGYQ